MNLIEIIRLLSGWSGNEDIIAAMQENWLMWSMTWESSRRGGHFVFEAPRKDRSEAKP